MNPERRILLAAALALSVTGCADGVLFVTKTSLSILEADTKPAGISIAYNRIEGYLGPTSESGEAPAVLGYFGSDGSIFAPKVQQVYATGNAARILVDANQRCTPAKIDDPGRVMFFGTSTSAGLSVSFTANAPVPDSFVFGWRRKEFSLIPLSVASEDYTCKDDAGKELGKIVKGQKYYPATLASVNSARSVTLPGGNVTLTDQQYFATGHAATGLAAMPEVKGQIRTLSKGVFSDYYEAEQAQRAEAVVLAACYAGLRPADRPKVWDEAGRLGLYQDAAGDDTNALLQAAFKQSVDAQGNVTEPARLARADRIYVRAVVTAPGGSDPARLRLLGIHKKTICDLSALNVK